MPVGLKHLRQQLFAERPVRARAADGLTLIEAPGSVGEARLAARQVRKWLDDGVQPDSIILTARDLPANVPLLQETFDEYSIPAAWPAPRVRRCGAVAALCRAWSLAERDFPFRGVSALWRNTYFRPAFEADLPLKSDLLLHDLRVPRSRAAYLAAVERWAADTPPAPLEDEAMAASQRAELSRVAKRCLGFYRWFFGVWDEVPPRAAPQQYFEHFRRMLGEFGIAAEPLPGAGDAAGLSAFLNAVEGWQATAPRDAITAAAFGQQLVHLADHTPWPQPPTEEGVRIIPLDSLGNAECSHLIMLGLGEGSIPRFDDSPREERLLAERELFRRAVSLPQTQLVLSRPALDSKGQALLPSTFLEAVAACFEEIPRVRQLMLIENYFTQRPLSPAEARVRYAHALVSNAPTTNLPPIPTAGNLAAARRMADCRFRATEPNPYHGRLEQPANLDRVAQRFGPHYIFSASSLDRYLDCPFKFLMGKVLKFAPLEEPSDDMEATHRGTAVHRAMRRFHEKKPQARPDRRRYELEVAWGSVVSEEVDRAAGEVPAAIWRLERRRVQRAFNRYPEKWDKFISDYAKAGVVPEPQRYEAEFGFIQANATTLPPLVIEVDGVTVRIGGTIDRVDIAKLDDGDGFWVIDYKTGKGTNYRAGEVAALERLQLPLYALAIERIFEPGGTARPLGLLYWIIEKDGSRHMLPDGRSKQSWLQQPGLWPAFRERLEYVVASMVRSLRGGDFRLAPRKPDVCEYCDFKRVCRINQHRDRLTPLPITDEPA